MRLFFHLTMLLGVLLTCGCTRPAPRTDTEGLEVSPALAALLNPEDEPNPYSIKPPDAPDSGCTPLRVNGIGGTLGRVFNDSNYRHLEYARAGGIRPLSNAASAWANGIGLVEVVSDRYLFVDSLSHSFPYLKPHAAALLHEIGKRFADSLAARGGGAYRPKVTSVLRTPLTVGRLRRVNRNATSESAHQYATTFDISYSKFVCDDTSAPHRTFEDLKNLLAEIIHDLRSEGRCLVKHERHQACFHITAAPPDSI